MFGFKKKPKCYFCERVRGLFHSVHSYGIYGEMGERHYYHPECLELIEMNPEGSGHLMVDKALYLHELKDSCMKNTNSDIIKEHKRKVEKLHQINFERMMPKKT